MLQPLVNLLDYLFNFSPPQAFPLQIVVWILVALGLLAAIGIIFKIRSTQDKFKKKHLREYPSKLIILSVLLLINVFSRLNRVDLLSMRVITIFLSLWIVYSLYELYRDLVAKKVESPSLHNESQQIKYHIHKNKKKKHRVH